MRRLVLGRRAFLRIAAAGGATASLPWLPGCTDSGVAPPGAGFLAPAERSTLAALVDAIAPADETVGAVEAGVVDYVDRWLAALDGPRPDVFRSGPFSGRWPFPDPGTGGPGEAWPANDMARPLPLGRMEELAARVALEGTAAVPALAANAPFAPPTRGLRAIYRDGLAALDEAARATGADGLGALEATARLGAFAAAPADFQRAVLESVAEGMFCAPEYGGNRDGIAWRDHHYDGDSQPLGHSIVDPATGATTDRADAPNQSLDPNLPNDGLDPAVESFVAGLVAGLGGTRFF